MIRNVYSLISVAMFAVLLIAPRFAKAADEPYTHQADVIYGRKHGVALTMDVFTPKEKANGAAVIWVVSGGWVSSHAAVNPGIPTELVKRGYTVFAVVHGSQPKYTIPEVLEDMHRSVRYIRAHAKDYKIDPDRIGITGGSAGGHLSLMQGLAETPAIPRPRTPSTRFPAACRRWHASFLPPIF
jgi:acetyl esterase/lipase